MSHIEHEQVKCDSVCDNEVNQSKDQIEQRKKEKLRKRIEKKIKKEQRKKEKEQKKKEKIAKKVRDKFEVDKNVKTDHVNKIRRKGINRIVKEYKMVINSDICDIVLTDEDRFDSFIIRFTPKGGHYAEQTLLLSLKTNNPSQNNTYPFCCPHMVLLTPIWHTNISTNGTICVDFLYNNSQWSPSFSFTTLIAQMQLLFSEPEISSGHYNMAATKMFRNALGANDFVEYDKKCKDFYNTIPGLRKKLSNFDHLYKLQHPDRAPVGL